MNNETNRAEAPASPVDERELFEATVQLPRDMFEREGDFYINLKAAAMWSVWQAARRVPAEQRDEVVGPIPTLAEMRELLNTATGASQEPAQDDGKGVDHG